MDNVELFIKYIALIIEKEGMDYIERANTTMNNSLQFSDDELQALQLLSIQAREKFEV